MQPLTGQSCRIGENLKVLGKGTVTLGDQVTIGNNVIINIKENLSIGDRSVIADNFIIEGRNIRIGKEFWSGHHCQIGGGSCLENPSSLEIGDQCHLGIYSFINTARAVKIGNEVGLGQNTRIYTHGAYLSALDGFPVEFGPITIEDRVWCPNAMIMPNVTIGHDTVVGAGAVVTKSLPPGCFAAGIPAKIIRENCYPKKLSPEERENFIQQFLQHFENDIVSQSIGARYNKEEDTLLLKDVLFDFKNKQVIGKATEISERLRNEFRRYGIRFRSYPTNGSYTQW